MLAPLSRGKHLSSEVFIHAFVINFGRHRVKNPKSKPLKFLLFSRNRFKITHRVDVFKKYSLNEFMVKIC